MYQEVIDFIRQHYHQAEFVPLHAPRFQGREKELLLDCIDSTFVSSVGKYVDEAERKFAAFVGAKYAVAVMNGTAALHLSLVLADVQADDEVITQPLSFVATCNAIRYQKAHPVFVDVASSTLGLSPTALQAFLEEETEMRGGLCYNRRSGRRIKACVPMHTFGHPAELNELKELCDRYKLALIEDAAEAVGSYYNGQHVGNSGLMATYSFNGNKVITCGGGGMLTTNDEFLAKRAKYLSTVAKVPHAYEFFHDELGYNYRMPNLNAALLVAQLEELPSFLADKRKTAEVYRHFFQTQAGLELIEEPIHCKSNFWLNAVLLDNREARNHFLEETNARGIMTRPVWQLMPDLPEFEHCQVHSDQNSRRLADRLVNIPSSVRK